MNREATDRIRAAWDGQANSWYSQREALLSASRPVHEWLVEQIEPSAGKQVLEIAAGPGDTGFMAARRLGSGRLVSTDLAPAMVEAARRRGAELGIENADYRVLDAQAMDVDDDSFDAVLCRWGLMLMPDPAACLRECRRVLRQGGRLGLAVFTGPDENPFASLPVRALAEAGHLPPAPEGWRPGILALGNRARLQALLDEAGFASTRVESIDMTWTFPTTDAFWSFLVELTALAPVVRALSSEASAALRESIDQQLASFRVADHFVLPSRCWGALAIR